MDFDTKNIWQIVQYHTDDDSVCKNILMLDGAKLFFEDQEEPTIVGVAFAFLDHFDTEDGRRIWVGEHGFYEPEHRGKVVQHFVAMLQQLPDHYHTVNQEPS